MPTVIDLITEPSLREPVVRSLRHRQKGNVEVEDSHEDRLMLSGFSWDGYLALDEALGHDRSSPRLYFLDGVVEIIEHLSQARRTQEVDR